MNTEIFGIYGTNGILHRFFPFSFSHKNLDLINYMDIMCIMYLWMRLTDIINNILE